MTRSRLSLSLLILLVIPVNAAYGQLDVRKDPAGTPAVPRISNPLDGGYHAYFMLTLFVTLLATGILVSKGKVPALERCMNFVLNFELTRRMALATMIVILSVYIGLSLNELQAEEYGISGDYGVYKNHVMNFPANIDTLAKDFSIVNVTLNWLSLAVLGNIRIVPFLASISLLIITYLLTEKMTHKRLAGIVATLLLVQSPIFFKYDTLASYDRLWILFYVTSLYLLFTRWYLSHTSSILSIFSKGLTAIYIPMTVYLIHSSSFSRRQKLYMIIPYLVLIPIVAILVATFFSHIFRVDMNLFWGVFYELTIELDQVTITLILPLTIGLYIASRKGVRYASSAMLLLAGVIFANFILVGFTQFTSFQYRLVPISVFFAVSIGILFSKRNSRISQGDRLRDVVLVLSILLTIILTIYAISSSAGNYIISQLSTSFSIYYTVIVPLIQTQESFYITCICPT